VPIYSATATVLIDPEPPKVLNIQEVAPMGTSGWDPNYYPTQYEIIKSKPVLTRTIEALNLKTRLPEVGSSREPHRAVLASLSVEPKRNTRLIQIRYEHRDPVIAAEVANAVAAAYVQYNLDLKLKGARDALAWLTSEAASLKRKVEDSSAALQNYRVKAGILGTLEQRQITAAKIMDFNKAYLEAQAQRMTVDAKLRELNQIAKDPAGAQTIFTVADNLSAETQGHIYFHGLEVTVIPQVVMFNDDLVFIQILGQLCTLQKSVSDVRTQHVVQRIRQAERYSIEAPT
jgi:uncharacterized protein involved in exopolysaccharide biosynthesis